MSLRTIFGQNNYKPPINFANPTITKLYANDATAGDYFGTSVALNADGTIALIGAYMAGGTGAVYVFTRQGSTWTQQQKLFASDKTANAYFGISVALNDSGDTALIGASGAGGKGKTYYFKRTNATWTETQSFVSSDLASGDSFGEALSIDGDGLNAVISSPGLGGKGAVYHFSRSGNTWTQQSKITSTLTQTGDHFGGGCYINAAADTILVGAVFDNSKTTAAGAVYVFLRTGSVWTYQQRFTPSDALANDWFGNDFGADNQLSKILISAHGSDAKGTDMGAVYVYNRTYNTYTVERKLLCPDPIKYFGAAVAMSHDGAWAMISGSFNTDKGAGAGAVYLYS